MNEYDGISANDKSGNQFYIFRFTYVPYILQDDVKSDVIQLTYCYPVCNAIYSYTGQHKSRFNINPFKDKNYDCINEDSCYYKP